jgi:uncharacterized protein (TIGR02145 family)
MDFLNKINLKGNKIIDSIDVELLKSANIEKSIDFINPIFDVDYAVDFLSEIHNFGKPVISTNPTPDPDPDPDPVYVPTKLSEFENDTNFITINDVVVSLDNIIYVSKNGNNLTAQRGILNKPFQTITAAKDIAQPGDLIYVFPGIYIDGYILKDGVNYYLHEGVIIKGESLPVISTTDLGTINCSVMGYGEFRSMVNVVQFGAGQNENSKIYVECNRIFGHSTSSYAVLVRSNNIKVNLICRGIIEGGARALDFHSGCNVKIKAETVKITNAYNQWCNIIQCSAGTFTGGFIDIELDYFEEPAGSYTIFGAIQLFSATTTIRLSVKEIIEDYRTAGSVIDINQINKLIINANFKVPTIPFLVTALTTYIVEINGDVFCENTNGLTLRGLGHCIFNGTIEGPANAIRIISTGASLTLKNAVLKTTAECIFSTVANKIITVIGDLQYTIDPNENIILSTEFKKFPKVLTEQEKSDFNSTSGASEILNKPIKYNEVIKTGYGFLYNYESIVQSLTTNFISGYRVASNTEWDNLISIFGGESIAGRLCKANRISPMVSPRWLTGSNLSDILKISILPGGIRNSNNFESLETKACFWSATNFDTDNAWYYNINHDSDEFQKLTTLKTFGLSVRLVRDLEGSESSLSDGTFLSNIKDFEGNVYQTVKIGNYVWMVQNLKTKHFSDGTVISTITEQNDWLNSDTFNYCIYNNDIYLTGLTYTDEKILHNIVGVNNHKVESSSIEGIGSISSLNIWTGTQIEFDNLIPKPKNTIFFCGNFS